MSPPHAIAAFNEELARAKLAALRTIQGLMTALDDPDPPIPPRYRELRLLAVTILRTQPISTTAAPASLRTPPHDSTTPPPPAPPAPATAPTAGAPSVPPPSPNSPTPPSHHATDSHTPGRAPAPHPATPGNTPFRPHQEWATTAIRSLVKSGHLPPIFEHLAQPPPPTPSAPAPPPAPPSANARAADAPAVSPSENIMPELTSAPANRPSSGAPTAAMLVAYNRGGG